MGENQSVDEMTIGEMAKEFLILAMLNCDGACTSEERKRLLELRRRLDVLSKDFIWEIAMCQAHKEMLLWWHAVPSERREEILRGGEQDQGDT